MKDGSDPAITPFQQPEGDTPSGDSPDWMREYLERRIGGRPLMVYLVLFAGAATLLLLLAIVWIFATGSGESEQPICLDIGKDDAIAQIYAGAVQRVNVLVDDETPTLGPFALQLDMSDGSCRKLPQGIDNQSGMLEVLGAVEFSNTIGDQRVRTNYQRKQVPAELMQTATPTPEVSTPTPEDAQESPTAVPETLETVASDDDGTGTPAPTTETIGDEIGETATGTPIS